MTPNHSDTSRDETYSLLLSLFESGKELGKMYRQYDGDLDWEEWLRETLPKVPGFFDKLEAYADKVATRKADEARIDELKRLDFDDVSDRRSSVTISLGEVEDRITTLKAQKEGKEL
jgi:hypothetical protein